jgi:oligoribonuclease NrnB/cAMP/cGMP phosphodiesterase (DHH superfamily)
MKYICIYHGNCFDGFAAAWVVHHFFAGPAADVTFFEGVYGEPPPPVENCEIYLVDFSYKRPMLEALAKNNTLIVLDHHKTAEADLEGLPFAHFDMERSGAGLTWDWFFPNDPRPALLNRIEDRDLWRFTLPDTRIVQAALSSYPFEFQVYDELMRRPIESFYPEGKALERKQLRDVEQANKTLRREMVIGGHKIPVANASYTITSDLGNLMSQGQPFAACYWDTKDGRVFSLRSASDGLDVAEIAKKYGGGGHKNASGFTMPLGWEGDAPWNSCDVTVPGEV